MDLDRIVRYKDGSGEGCQVALVRPDEEDGLFEGRAGQNPDLFKFGGFLAMRVSAGAALMLEDPEFPAEQRRRLLGAHFESADPTGDDPNLKNVARVKDEAGVIVMRHYPKHPEHVRVEPNNPHHKSTMVKEFRSGEIAGLRTAN